MLIRVKKRGAKRKGKRHRVDEARIAADRNKLGQKDSQVMLAASRANLLCVIDKKAIKESRYTFYDRITGQQLARATYDWEEGIKRALERQQH